MKQHAKPCSTCPFLRTCTPGQLGGSPVETFIGQAFGGFWIPCHEQIDYSDPGWRTKFDTPQCAGTAIYRANCHPADRANLILVLPSSDTVFSSPAQFMAHHLRISVEEAENRLGRRPPSFYWMVEMDDPRAQIVSKEDMAITQLERFAEDVVSHGPTRVMVSDDTAMPAPAARRQFNITPDVIFIRKDGWSLGAPQHLEAQARKQWPDQWLGLLRRGSTKPEEI